MAALKTMRNKKAVFTFIRLMQLNYYYSWRS